MTPSHPLTSVKANEHKSTSHTNQGDTTENGIIVGIAFDYYTLSPLHNSKPVK